MEWGCKVVRKRNTFWNTSIRGPIMSECQVRIANGINQIFPVTSQDKPQKGKKDCLLYSNLLNVICDAIQPQNGDGVLYIYLGNQYRILGSHMRKTKCFCRSQLRIILVFIHKPSTVNIVRTTMPVLRQICSVSLT